jgi:hypothetical protein
MNKLILIIVDHVAINAHLVLFVLPVYAVAVLLRGKYHVTEHVLQPIAIIAAHVALPVQVPHRIALVQDQLLYARRVHMEQPVDVKQLRNYRHLVTS